MCYTFLKYAFTFRRRKEEACKSESPSPQAQDEANNNVKTGASDEVYEEMSDEVFDKGKEVVVVEENSNKDKSSVETPPSDVVQENTQQGRYKWEMSGIGLSVKSCRSTLVR